MVKTQSLIDDVKEDVKDHILNNYNYVGFGDSAVPASIGQTAMGNEITRIARQTTTELTNNVIISAYLNSTEGNGSTYQEIAVFDTGTAGANEMQERIVLGSSYTKTSDKELWVDFNTEIEVIEE